MAFKMLGLQKNKLRKDSEFSHQNFITHGLEKVFRPSQREIKFTGCRSEELAQKQKVQIGWGIPLDDSDRYHLSIS